MSSGFDYRGFLQLRDQIVLMEQGFKTWLEAFLVKQALMALARSKENTPVDTGYLRENWFIGNINRTGDKIEIYITNQVEYASFVEYGHMNRNRTKWIEGFFMCTLAISAVERNMPTRFNRDFSLWVRSLGAEAR